MSQTQGRRTAFSRRWRALILPLGLLLLWAALVGYALLLFIA